MNRKTTISLLLGTAISVAALYIAFRNIPLDDLLIYLSSINYLWIIPAVAASLSAFLIRALRWQSILEPVRKITLIQAFHPLMIGFMLNIILPGRIGEVARPAVLHKQEKINFSTGLATVAIERIFDIIIMFLFFSVLMVNIKIDPDLVVDFGNYHLNRETLVDAAETTVAIGAMIIATIFVFVFKKARGLLNIAIMKLPDLFFFLSPSSKKRLGEKFCVPFQSVIENFSAGFLLVRHPVRLLICFILTAVIWMLTALSYYLLALGCPGIDLSFMELSAVMIIVCFFIALPSAPGFWGLWEAGGIFAMSLFGISSIDAAGYTITNHVMQLFPVLIAGLASAAVIGISIRNLSFGSKGLSNGNT